MTTTLNASTAGAGGFIATSDNSGILALQTAGTTAITVDTSQKVGIGTTSPSTKLSVVQNQNGASQVSLLNNTGGASSQALFNANDGTNYGQFGMWGSGVSASGAQQPSNAFVYGSGGISYFTGGVHRWYYNTNSEAMRIDSSGNLLVGTTSSSGKLTVSANLSVSPRVMAVLSNTASDAGTGALVVSKFDNTTTTSQVFVAFAVNNNSIGSGQINANGSGSAAFGSYSDRRLKENIVDLPSQLANIMALRPVEYDYIQSEGGGHQIGFIAQDVQNVYPDLVGERADGMLTLTDLNKNDARLIKAIQELKAINDTQAETINALTARVVALESK